MKTKKEISYIKIPSPYHPYKDKNGFVQEHRLIVENKLKRFLTPEEVIHHINEDKKDNRIENLMLFKNQKEHQKFHLKLKQFGITNPIKRQIENRWNNE